MAIMKKLLILLLFIPYFGFSQGVKGSALTEATDINYNDYFFLIQSGVTKKVQFYRFSYNTDSAANQIQDSLVNYLAKIDSSDYVTITRLNDSLYYYSSITGLVDSLAKYTTKVMLNDSLAIYKWTEDSTARVVHDSLVNYNNPTFGTDGQVPFMNVAGSDFSYSSSIIYDNDNEILSVLYINSVAMTGDSSTISFDINGVTLLTEGVSGSDYTTITLQDTISTIKSVGQLNSNIILKPTSIDVGINADATHLIYGDFANDSIIINGVEKVTGMLDHSSSANMPKIYNQATEPDIPNNTTAYWVDSDDSKYYLILDLAGTQKKLELL